MNFTFKKIVTFFDKQDLTKGSPTKGIIFFLVPILLCTILQQFYSLTDAMIVGQALPEYSVAAINSSGSIMFIVLNLGLGCASGFSVILSRYVGAKDVNEAKRSFLTQCILMIGVSIVVSVAGILLIKPMLSMLGIVDAAGDPLMKKEYQEARTYLLYMFGGAIATLGYNLMFSNLRAKGDSFAPFCFLVLGVILNIGLDFLFIRVFEWGVAGSAGATLISQVIVLIICFVYGRIRYEEFRFDFKNAKPRKYDYLVHLKNGLPLGFQFSILGFGIIAMTSSVVKFDINPNGSLVAGVPAQIGYGVACKLINLLLAPLSSLGVAMLSYVSQNYGAKNIDRIKAGIRSGLLIGVVITLLMNAIGLPLLINGFYQYIFLSKDKISEMSIFYGNIYLYISIPGLFFLMILFVFRSVSQGLEKPQVPFISGVVELFSRLFMVLALPYLIFKAINSTTPLAAYYLVASGDVVSWFLGGLALLIPSVITVRKLLKDGRFWVK